MAIKTKDELMNEIKEKFKDDTSDETLAFLGDITDTVNDYDAKVKDSTDWKKKYEDNDKKWRDKYKERFFSGEPDDSTEPPKTEPEQKPIRNYSDLFTFSKTKEK